MSIQNIKIILWRAKFNFYKVNFNLSLGNYH